MEVNMHSAIAMDDRMLGMLGEDRRFLEKLKKDESALQKLEILSEAARKEDPQIAIPKLYRAAMEGDWEEACHQFHHNQSAKTAKISNLGMTALHVAASCGQSEFVQKLVKELAKEQLEARDQLDRTALHHVALAADVNAAKAMVDKNPILPCLGDMNKLTPLFYAAKWRHPSKSKKMVEYLYGVSRDEDLLRDHERSDLCNAFTDASAPDLIVAITASGSYDTALRILERYPELALKKNTEGMSILHVLAMKPKAFRSGNELSPLISWIYDFDDEDSTNRCSAASFIKYMSKFIKGITEMSDIKQSHVRAVRLVEFVCDELHKKEKEEEEKKKKEREPEKEKKQEKEPEKEREKEKKEKEEEEKGKEPEKEKKQEKELEKEREKEKKEKEKEEKGKAPEKEEEQSHGHIGRVVKFLFRKVRAKLQEKRKQKEEGKGKGKGKMEGKEGEKEKAQEQGKGKEKAQKKGEENEQEKGKEEGKGEEEEEMDFVTDFFIPKDSTAILHLAVEHGVFELVEKCLKFFPDLIWYADKPPKSVPWRHAHYTSEVVGHLLWNDATQHEHASTSTATWNPQVGTKYTDTTSGHWKWHEGQYADTATRTGRLLLHVAIEHRRVEIFNYLITLIGKNTKAYADLKLEGNNNSLHLAANLAPTPQLQSVPGPAFQMQRELQWFKAVEELVYDELKTEKNSNDKTPREVLFDAHKDLLSSAKEWMKDTSHSCMVVAALVATVAFAAMITVPGGNNTNTGFPVLAGRKLFVAFSASNALSMVSSAVSLVMLLSIQTSRYTEGDFLDSLPKKLLRGLLSLFIAIATMMISFGSAIGLSLQKRIKWSYISITVIACIPVIIFTWLQLPLLLQAIRVESGPGIFQGQRDRKLCCTKKIGCSRLAYDRV